MLTHQIKEGLVGLYEKETNTDDAYEGSNNEVLDFLVATPSIMRMIIDGVTDLLEKNLPADYMTVGKKIDLTHEQPSLVGETIKVKITVKSVIDRSVILDIEGFDSKGKIFIADYEVRIISKKRLLDVAYKRSPEFV